MSAERVARTILDQLGGGRFLVMTGARDLSCSDAERGSLSMVLPSGKARRVTITLTHTDTYTLTAWSRGGAVKAHTGGIYSDQLSQVFESMTGLATKL